VGSLDHLKRKWNVVNRGYLADRYEDAGWRRKAHISKRISRKLTLGVPVTALDGWVDKLVAGWSRRMAKEYAATAKQQGYF
jgi:hypothetical protein